MAKHENGRNQGSIEVGTCEPESLLTASTGHADSQMCSPDSLIDGRLATKEAKRLLAQKAARRESSRRKQNVIRQVWAEYDPADIKRKGKLRAYKEVGEIAANHLGLKKPIPAETVRKRIS